MDNRLLVLILIMIAFTISETIAVMAQSNESVPNRTDIELGSDDNRIIINMNGTDVILLDQATAFTIGKHDFLKGVCPTF
jgi:hypothetical protein